MGGRQQGKGYDSRKSDRKTERMKREMAKQRRKVVKGEPRKAVVYLDSSGQQLKDVMQENHELKLALDIAESHARSQERYADRVVAENVMLYEKIGSLRDNFTALLIVNVVLVLIICLWKG